MQVNTCETHYAAGKMHCNLIDIKEKIIGKVE